MCEVFDIEDTRLRRAVCSRVREVWGKGGLDVRRGSKELVAGVVSNEQQDDAVV